MSWPWRSARRFQLEWSCPHCPTTIVMADAHQSALNAKVTLHARWHQDHYHRCDAGHCYCHDEDQCSYGI